MFDLAIVNGMLIDPLEKRVTVAHLYAKDGHVADISREIYPAARTIDAQGKYVSPGFIDIHAHIEGHEQNGALLLRQGVTTVLNGNCGMSPQNIGTFLRGQNETGFLLNQIELCGATMLRQSVGQQDPYAPLSPAQLDAAVALLEQALDEGAAGVSFGLEYTPGSSSEEVLALSRVAARYGKLVAVHTRADCYPGLKALKEAIAINRETGAGVQISHVVYQYGFGMMREALEIIDEAIAHGYDISCDSGMYTSFATYIGTPVFEESCFEKWGCAYGDLFAANGKYAGQYLTKETYEELRRERPNDVAIALIGKPHEIPMAFELPYMMASSDAGVNQTDDTSKGHPQDAGTFPRFLRQLVVERSQLTLPDAIARITLLPAQRLKLANKGRLVVGADADITVFDLAALKDCSRFPHEGRPDTPPKGIEHVIVGGRLALSRGEVLDGKAGKALPAENSRWIF